MAASVRSYVNATHEQNGTSINANNRANGHYERSATRPLRDFKSPHMFTKLELSALSVDGFANLNRLTTLDAIVAIRDFRILRLNRNMLAHFRNFDSTNTETLLFSDFTPFMANYIHLYELIEHEFKNDLATAGLLPGNEPLPENPTPVTSNTHASPIKNIFGSQLAQPNGLSPITEAPKASDVSMDDASANAAPSTPAAPLVSSAPPASSNGLFTPNKPNGSTSLFGSPSTVEKPTPAPPPAFNFSSSTPNPKRKATDEGLNPKAPRPEPSARGGSDREFEQAVAASSAQMSTRRIATPKGRLNRTAQPLSSTSAQTLNRMIEEPIKTPGTFVFGDVTQQGSKSSAFQFGGGSGSAFSGISAAAPNAPQQSGQTSEKPASNPFAGFGQSTVQEPAKTVEKPATNMFTFGQKPASEAPKTLETPVGNMFSSFGQKPAASATTADKPAANLFSGFGQKPASEPVQSVEKPASNLFSGFGQKAAQTSEKPTSSLTFGFGQKPAEEPIKANPFSNIFTGAQSKPADAPSITIASPSPIKPGAGFQPTGFRPTGFTPTPSPHGSGTNTPDFMAQFGQKAEKFVKEKKQREKDEDFDSDEDDAEEWEKNYKEKEAAKAEDFKKMQNSLALPPKFGPTGGAADLSRSVSPAGSVGSVLNGPMPKGPHIFSNVGSPAAEQDDEEDDQADSGEEDDDEDDGEDDEDEEAQSDDTASKAKSAFSSSNPQSLLNRITPRSPEKSTTSLFGGGGSATPQNPPPSTFRFTPSVNTTKDSATSTGKSLFGGNTTTAGTTKPLFDFAKAASTSTNGNVSLFGNSTATPQNPAKSPFTFPSTTATPKDNTNDKPLFGATSTPAQTSSLFSFAKSTPVAESSPTAPTPTPTPKVTGFTFTPLAKTASTPFKFPASASHMSTLESLPASGVTTPSGLRTPTPVSNAVSSDENTNDAEDTPSQPQLDLLGFASYSVDNDIIWELEKAKAFIHKDNTWEVIGVGPMAILNNKESGRASIVMKAAPSGRVILNTYILKDVKYEAVGPKRMRFAVIGEKGKVELWLIQVGKAEDATEFLDAVKKSQEKL